MLQFGFAFGANRGSVGGETVPDPAPSAPTGFALNGSTNATLRAMLAGVRAGSRRGKIVFKGDSTTVGDGGGANGNRVAGARANRPPAILASLLTTAGTLALDGACFNGNVDGTGTPDGNIGAYDPRVSLGSWFYGSATTAGAFAHEFAGSGYFGGQTGAPFTFSPGMPVDTFEVMLYHTGTGNVTFLIDGAAPATGPATVTLGTDGHIQRVTVTASARGTHVLSIASDSQSVAMRSVSAYDSATKAIDIHVHAGCAVTSGGQATTNSIDRNNDSLGFDAPDFTIINCGFNDMAQGVPAQTYAANLQAMITKAKASGDVLLVFPHPAAAPFNNNVDAFRIAAPQLAASNNVAFLSLYDYFGGSFTPALQARMYDGQVHPKAEMYAEIADVYRRCIAAMVA